MPTWHPGRTVCTAFASDAVNVAIPQRVGG
jgi:hypothetical protein